MKRFGIIAAAFLTFAVMFPACRQNAGDSIFDTVYYRPAFAGGFEITGMKDSCSRVIRVLSSWQEDSGHVRELFIARNGEIPPEGFAGQVLKDSAMRIAAMSSSHIALLDLIGETDRVKAVSGMRFISNRNILSRKDSIADIGNEADADLESLVSTRPDIVLLYGIRSSSALEGRLANLGIPFIYIGEYLETDPLGRAEWVVALSEITGCAKKGIKAFNRIAARYMALKSCLPEESSRPEVMLNIPYGDIWYMAPVNSAMTNLVRDAGAGYVFKENTTSRSVPIDMEEAFILTSAADFWLNAGTPESFSQFLENHPEFAGTGCVSGKRVYSCDKRSTAGGGSDFWETGPARPDLVLEDLIRIFHPEAALPLPEKEKAEGNDGADKSGDGKESGNKDTTDEAGDGKKSGNKDTTDEAGDGLIFYYRIIP